MDEEQILLSEVGLAAEARAEGLEVLAGDEVHPHIAVEETTAVQDALKALGVPGVHEVLVALGILAVLDVKNTFFLMICCSFCWVIAIYLWLGFLHLELLVSPAKLYEKSFT